MCRDRHKLKSDSADQTRVHLNMAEVRLRQNNTVTLSTQVRLATLERAQVPNIAESKCWLIWCRNPSRPRASAAVESDHVISHSSKHNDRIRVKKELDTSLI